MQHGRNRVHAIIFGRVALPGANVPVRVGNPLLLLAWQIVCEVEVFPELVTSLALCHVGSLDAAEKGEALDAESARRVHQLEEGLPVDLDEVGVPLRHAAVRHDVGHQWSLDLCRRGVLVVHHVFDELGQGCLLHRDLQLRIHAVGASKLLQAVRGASCLCIQLYDLTIRRLELERLAAQLLWHVQLLRGEVVCLEDVVHTARHRSGAQLVGQTQSSPQ
mmetsp:Transcript_29797/g.80621  ORF Transcript_29797/g.80621 Transcript_29797/m.80621 type:complete len:219 (-) Transcript_29797:16-672(-)